MRSWKHCSCASLSLLLSALLLVCAGCAPAAADYADAFPEPPDVDISWVGGEASALRSLPAVIYTADSEGSRLIPSNVSVTILAGETFAEALVKEFLLAQWPQSSAPLLDCVEESGDTITVNLAGSLGDAARDVFAKARAITKTLTGIAGINYVNLLENGAALSVEGLPQGALSAPANDIASEYYLMTGTVLSRKAETQLSAYNVTLYFPTAQDGWLMPEIHRVDMSPPEDDAADASAFLIPILNELFQGPRSPSGLTALMPDVATVSEVTVDTFGDGTRIVRVGLSGEAMRYVSRGLITEKQLAGAVVLTITTFMPAVSAVSIEIDGRQMQTLDAEYMPSGWMQRRQFEGLIAKPLVLYFPDGESGRLIRAERPVSAFAATTPLMCARELFAGVRRSDGIEAGSALPHIVAEDVLGTIILEDTLYLNLSEGGASSLKAIGEKDARLCAYAIVNTLVDFASVKRVQLLVNGRREDAVIADIYTGAPLMKRSGME